MDWFFEGLGTLAVGLVIGGGIGGGAGWRLAMRRMKQVQRAGDHATQVQAGRDVNERKR